MKHLKKFNELNTDTYDSASRLAKKYGRHTLSDDLEKHSLEMRIRNNPSIDIEYTSNNGVVKETTTLTFLNNSPHMTMDVWNDSIVVGDNEIDDEIDLIINLNFIDNVDNGMMSIYIENDNLSIINAKEDNDDEGEVYEFRCLDKSSGRKLKRLIIDACDVVLKNIDGYTEPDLVIEKIKLIKNISIHKLIK